MKYLQTQSFKIDKKEDGTYAVRVPKETIGHTTTKSSNKVVDPEKAKNHFCYVCQKISGGKVEAQSPVKSSVRAPAQ